MMLDAEFERLATDQIRVGFAEQDDQLELDEAAKVTELHNRNMIFSTSAAKILGRLYGDDIQRRGDIALDRIDKVASKITIRATDDFETELTAVLEDLLGVEVDKLREKLNNQPTILRGKADQDGTHSYHQTGNELFDEAVGQMFNKLRSEMALFAAGITGPALIIDETPTPLGVNRSVIFPLPPDYDEDQPEPDSAPERTDRWFSKSNIMGGVYTVAAIVAAILIAIFVSA